MRGVLSSQEAPSTALVNDEHVEAENRIDHAVS